MPDLKSSNAYKVSVRKLVEFACRQGDLTHEGVAGPTAQEGQLAHKKLQGLRQEGEQAEVKVTAEINNSDGCLIISGRVDLLCIDNNTCSIGEIKSCYAPVEKIPQSSRDLHWAQLKVYGFCVLSNDTCTTEKISLRLIWANIITNDVTVEESVFTREELKEFTNIAAQRYLTWMSIVNELQASTVKSAKALAFPHADYRDGQRNMAAGVFVTTRDKATLLCEAPTGIGKTISTLFPAAKAIGENLIESVVYLTAKTSGRQSANDALTQLQDSGLFVTAITVTSKKTTCHCSNGTCERDSQGRCPQTIGFFDRLPEARQSLLSKGIISPQNVDEAAHQFQLCPFELTLQMLPWVSVVICDYNYVFDPLVRLHHFNERSNKRLILVDEAHNLIDRARSMYSAQLVKSQMTAASKITSLDSAFLGKAFTRLANSLDRYAKQSDQPEFSENKPSQAITKSVKNCVDALTSTLENQYPITEAQADAAKELYRYLVIEDLFDDHHKAITSTHKSKGARQVTHKLQCLNATRKLESSFKQFRASVVFSATLRPQHYFRETLGLPENTTCVSLPSPFLKSQQGTFVCNWINTRYHARQNAIAPIVDIAHQVYLARQGNYQLYFPSYTFMESVYEAFIKKHPKIHTIIQKRGSTDKERNKYLQEFDQPQPVLGFAILGGIYGEGVDYIGDRLIGTIIVGTGLASPSLQQKLIEEDYYEQGLNPFDYASRYPGLTRVLQTAGRVIRSEKDNGVVILADQRFTDPFYQHLFPPHWRVTRCNSQDQLSDNLNDFWAENFALA